MAKAVATAFPFQQLLQFLDALSKVPKLHGLDGMIENAEGRPNLGGWRPCRQVPFQAIDGLVGGLLKATKGNLD